MFQKSFSFFYLFFKALKISLKFTFTPTLTNTFFLVVDGCKNYRVLSEADRAQGNAVRNDSYDRDLVTGWYRFQGAAGDGMPDKCVPPYRCGTWYPGWLNGAHPTVAEGVVTRQVCHSWRQSCCDESNIMKVKNCSSYYVYELPRSPIGRYCGNAGPGKLHSKCEIDR